MDGSSSHGLWGHTRLSTHGFLYKKRKGKRKIVLLNKKEDIIAVDGFNAIRVSVYTGLEKKDERKEKHCVCVYYSRMFTAPLGSDLPCLANS